MQKKLVCVNSKHCSESLELQSLMKSTQYPSGRFTDSFATIYEECGHRDGGSPRNLRLQDTREGEGGVCPQPLLLGRTGSGGGVS